ncbi:methylmalonyl-CoA epimerase [Pedobacter psychrophilus]|uniref:Methylmalonyl-CoA epimerase n=1 Tax=Pedobacter psychrophilus TaxID=1826909 RepID=A0A179DI41_9SPHI|nr:methylmalonyl-CoA epimerase [Pedobacter psychrophilus]OAQ40737.1 methylmalonyl-CoA epimerase [Pedobacter psychrophilus]
MVNKIEHIGIAVKNLNESSIIYEKILGVRSYKKEEVSSENVITEFFKIGNSKIELLQATNEDSAIAKFLDKKGEGLHHIAFEVDDIYKEIERLKSEGFKMINETPKLGADNKLICFVHPKSTNGVLIEICQEII